MFHYEQKSLLINYFVIEDPQSLNLCEHRSLFECNFMLLNQLIYKIFETAQKNFPQVSTFF